MKDFRNYSLKDHNTFGIDAKCSRYLEFEDDFEAMDVAEILRKSKKPYIIIGGGSNLLLTQDFDGIVVRSGIKGYEFEEDYFGCMRMTCGSGETWDDMVALSLNKGYYGMENLSLIPGDVGASAVQNIGAYGVDTRVTYALSKTFKPHLDYGNIRSELERKGIKEPTAQQLRDTIIEIRQAKLPDPKVMGNAGSFFMNPIVTKNRYEKLAVAYPNMPHYKVDSRHVKIPAGWMIEQCGWKGKSLGRAGVHDKQALVLVNRGGATGAEIVALCQQIQLDVKAKFGIEIHPEVNII